MGPSKAAQIAHVQREQLQEKEFAFRQTERKEAALAAAKAREDDRHHQFDLQGDRQSLDIGARDWPLRIPPAAYANYKIDQGVQPLVVAFVPPQLRDPDLSDEIADLCEHAIGNILRLEYNSNDPKRPVIFLDGRGWRRDAPRGGTALENLFYRAPQVPTAVIQLDTIGPHLHLKVGCFGFGPKGVITRPTISESGEVSLMGHAAEVARQDVERWRAVLSKLPTDINMDFTRIGVDFANLTLFDLEERTGEKLDEYYRTSPAHIREGARVVGPALQFAAAGLADFFHFTRHGSPPHLPTLLPRIADGSPKAIIEELSQHTLQHYEMMYCLHAQYAGHREADLLLDLAVGLAAMEDRLVDRSAVTRVLNSAVARFLSDHGCPVETTLLVYAQQTPSATDVPFLTKAARILQHLGQAEDAAILAGIAERLNAQPAEDMSMLPPDPFVSHMQHFRRRSLSGG